MPRKFPKCYMDKHEQKCEKRKKTEKEGKVLLITALSLQPSTLLTTIKLKKSSDNLHINEKKFDLCDICGYF